MGDPARWSDPRGGAPPEVQRLLAAARGGPPPIPDAVLGASTVAVAKLGSPLGGLAWASALKLLAVLAVAGLGGYALLRPAHLAPARPHAVAARSAPSALPALPAVAAAPVAAPSVRTASVMVAPSPASSPVAPRPGSDRAVEGALLRRAQRHLSEGHAALALVALREHAARYPRSALTEERDYLAFRARARDATPLEVDREVDRYLRLHPDGFYSPLVRSMRSSPP